MSNDKEIAELLSDLKKEIHDHAVYPLTQELHAYISLRTLDGILQKYINRHTEGKK